jgi:hypothetical protein
MTREDEKEFYDRLETAAHAHLEKHLAMLHERGIACRKELVFGVRIAEELRLARTLSADLIVLTAPRLDPENLESGWGSMSYKLSYFAPCPVLLVK